MVLYLLLYSIYYCTVSTITLYLLSYCFYYCSESIIVLYLLLYCIYYFTAYTFVLYLLLYFIYYYTVSTILNLLWYCIYYCNISDIVLYLLYPRLEMLCWCPGLWSTPQQNWCSNFSLLPSSNIIIDYSWYRSIIATASYNTWVLSVQQWVE